MIEDYRQVKGQGWPEEFGIIQVALYIWAIWKATNVGAVLSFCSRLSRPSSSFSFCSRLFCLLSSVISVLNWR
jgi:hypothetical protein